MLRLMELIWVLRWSGASRVPTTVASRSTCCTGAKAKVCERGLLDAPNFTCSARYPTVPAWRRAESWRTVKE